MNSILRFSLLFYLLTAVVRADRVGDTTSGVSGGNGAEPTDTLKQVRKEADSLKDLKSGVQITEIGSARAVFVFAKGSEHVETRVNEAFSNKDFRVFPSAVVIEGRIEPKALHKIGNDRFCDLVVFTKIVTEEKAPLGSLHRFDVEASVQIYNPMSEELLVSTTVRSSEEAKKRKVVTSHADTAEAKRAATYLALDAAVNETMTRTVEKAHKMLVHEAQFKGVVDHVHLLDIMNYTAKLVGVYHVRQLSYSKDTGLAIIEIISAPQTESYWRAYLDKLPKHEVLVQKGRTPVIKLNPELRKNHGIDFEKVGQ